jgi:hypothetical protein
VAWSDVPDVFAAFLFIGYGGANEFSLDLARKVLRGKAKAPDRSDVDAFFEDEAALRELIQHPVRP